MSIEQKKTCVFANQYKENNCSALKEHYCEQCKCNFYKSKEKYILEAGWLPKKKGHK